MEVTSKDPKSSFRGALRLKAARIGSREKRDRKHGLLMFSGNLYFKHILVKLLGERSSKILCD